MPSAEQTPQALHSGSAATHRFWPTWGRTVPQWSAALQGLGFSVRAASMSAGTPFANILLAADL